LALILIQILRAWAAGPDAEPNWLAGALDPQIGLALSAIHRKPGHDWTVSELARVCSLSRSAFAARFAARVGNRQPLTLHMYDWTPPLRCSAVPPSRSRLSPRTSVTRPRRPLAARSSTATASRRLAGDNAYGRSTRERPARIRGLRPHSAGWSGPRDAASCR